jgi:hypothetical protein
MKISNYSVALSGTSQKKVIFKTTQKLSAWTGNRQNGQNQISNEDDFDFKEYLKNLKSSISNDALEQTSSLDTYQQELYPISDQDQAKIEFLNKLFELLTGKKIKFYIPKKLITNQTMAPTAAGQSLSIINPQKASVKGWGFDYQLQNYYSEEEAMSFQSDGIVTTSDGKTIRFDLNLNLSRSFVSQSNLSMKGGDALTDPLVINFDKPSASLTQKKYSFDLDMDGKNDQISFTDTGSGFLAYDKNGDGIINNGSELFGPKTGNGFQELAQFDSDGNNWIDENDPIFDKLQIWTKDENGDDKLFAIGKKGIGAIYLGSADSSFSLKDDNNSTMGQLRQTGIFLREDGSAGTIQHIDISL